MSVFGSILSKVFGHGTANATTAQPVPAQAGVATGTMGSEPASAAAPASAAPPANAVASSGPPVDVVAVLTELAVKSGQPSNWQTSIVDMMKLLGLDSSLENRKQLAQELHYSGDSNDSATMNVWLHKQVMAKLAENGGKVPDALKN